MSQKTHEIKLGANTSQHDMSYRAKWTEDWLKGGDKVKISVIYRGREMKFVQDGPNVVTKFLSLLPADTWTFENKLKLAGRQWTVIVRPKTKK